MVRHPSAIRQEDSGGCCALLPATAIPCGCSLQAPEGRWCRTGLAEWNSTPVPSGRRALPGTALRASIEIHKLVRVQHQQTVHPQRLAVAQIAFPTSVLDD